MKDYSKMSLDEVIQEQMKDKLLDGEPLDDIMRDYNIYLNENKSSV